MNRKFSSILLLIFLVLAIIFASSSCKKLKLSRLKANHHFSKANAHYSNGKYRNAIEEYEIALVHNPNLVKAYRYLGESYKNIYNPSVDTPENTDKADKALQALKRAYEINPYDKDVIYSLGDMLDKLRNFEEAEKLYLRIIELEPANMENYYVVAGFYKRYVAVKASGGSVVKEGEGEEVGKTPFQKAEEMYLRRIELDSENPEGYAYIAQFYEDLQPPDFQKAYDFHNLRLKIEPDNPLIYYTIGVNRFWMAHRLQRDLSREERIALGEEAVNVLQKAIDLEPTYSSCYYYMNIVYRNIYANVFPERASRYIEEADMWQERAKEARKKELERKRLEEELRGTR